MTGGVRPARRSRRAPVGTAQARRSGGEHGPSDRSAVRVRLAIGPLSAPVLRRIVSMALTRAGWPLDRLDDALHVCDALCAHAPAYASDGHMTFDVRADPAEMELRVRELVGASNLLTDAELPGVGNVLERLADGVSTQPEDGRSEPRMDGGSAQSQVVVVLRAHR